MNISVLNVKYIDDLGSNNKKITDLFLSFLFLLPVGRQHLLCPLSSQAHQIGPTGRERLKHIRLCVQCVLQIYYKCEFPLAGQIKACLLKHEVLTSSRFEQFRGVLGYFG